MKDKKNNDQMKNMPYSCDYIYHQNTCDYTYHQRAFGKIVATVACAPVAEKKNDQKILERLKKFFWSNTGIYKPMEKSDFWQDMSGPMFKRLFTYLKNNNTEKALYFFNNMCINGATYGFITGKQASDELDELDVLDELGALNYCRSQINNISNLNDVVLLQMDPLVSLSEWLNLIPVESQGQEGRYITFHPDYFFDLLDKKLGIEFKIPSFQDYLIGITSKRGIFISRHIIAFYLALRIKEFCAGIESPRICEIGGGVGLLAYYLNLVGIKDISIIDIPYVSMISTYWMMKNMPDRSFLLGDDEKKYDSPDSIKVLFPEYFHNAPDHQFDLVINCDSMPEMNNEFISEYLTTIKRTSKLFYSINHDNHADLLKRNNVAYMISCMGEGRYETVFRNLFWLRRGYIEELYKIK